MPEERTHLDRSGRRDRPLSGKSVRRLSCEGLLGEADACPLGGGEHLAVDVLGRQPEMLGVAGGSEAEFEVLALDVPQRLRVVVGRIEPVDITELFST
jgi:hypothetical protein